MRCTARLLTAALLTTAPALQAQEPGDSLVRSLDALLDTRISSAAKYEQTISEAASSVTIISADAIRRHGYRTLAEALQSTRGFYLRYDRNYTYLGARGFSRPGDFNNRVLLLVDGNVVNEGIYGAMPVGSEAGIAMDDVERIEIIRGPGSALYGTGAVFAVINVVTRAPDAQPGVAGTVRGGSFGARGGSLGYRGALTPTLGVTFGGSWDGSEGQDLYYPEFDSPELNRGISADNDWERQGALSGSLRADGVMLHGRYSSRTKGVPTGAYDGSIVGKDTKTSDEYAALELRVDRSIDVSRRVASRAYFNSSRYTGHYPLGDELSIDQSVHEVVGAETTLNWDVASSNRLTVGGEVRHDLRARYAWPSGELPAADLPNTIVSVYLQDEHQLTRSLSLLAGLRYDGYRNSDDATSPRLAAIFAPGPSSTFKLLYGSAFRAPNMYEITNGGGYYKPNADLRPETARTVEATWQQRLTEGLLGSVSLFHYEVSDLIELVQDPSDDEYQYRNSQEARADGFEIELQGSLRRNAQGYLSYSYQRATDAVTGERLTNSPTHMVKAGTDRELTEWLAVGTDLRYESSRRTLLGGETDPAFVTDLAVTLPARPSGHGALGRLQAVFKIRNVFDATYAMPAGWEHRQTAIPQDGRTLSAELRYRFSK